MPARGETVVTVWPMAELAALVTVAEIELEELAAITHLSVAAPAEDGSAMREHVLVCLHAVTEGTVVVDAPGGKMDAPSCADAAWASLRTAVYSHLASDDLRVGRPGGVGVPWRQRGWPSADTPLVSVVVATRLTEIVQDFETAAICSSHVMGRVGSWKRIHRAGRVERRRRPVGL